MAKSSGIHGAVWTPRPEWHRTPWWAFWRPAWRRLDPGTWNTTHSWEYQTHKQRARDVLEKSYSPEWAYSRGGEGVGQQQAATNQQAPQNLSATDIAKRFNSLRAKP